VNYSEEEVQIVTTKSQKKGVSAKFSNMGLEIAGMRKRSLGAGAKGFEMYGIGAKLLAGMGFQPGRGLGKDLQGISAPIEAHVRKGRGAIGLYGKEKKTAPADEMVEQAIRKAAEDKEVGPKEVKWQKANKKEKVEYKYLTAEEVLVQKQLRVRPDAGHLAKVKVIDLTGPQQRVLSGYHAISAGQQKPLEEWAEEEARKDEREKMIFSGARAVFDIPELIHNVEILKDSCEQDIFKNDRKAKIASDRKLVITEELNRLKVTLSEEESMIEKMEKITSEMQNICNASNLELRNAYLMLGKLKRDHEEEWVLYQLYSLVPAIAIPLTKEALKIWDPLDDPRMPVQLLNDWAVLLGNQTEQYEIILWEAWMPSIRQANTNWNVKNAEPMVRLIEFWKPMLPQWLVELIYDQNLVPKLTQAVEDWDPLSDVIPIHSWIHPWLPFLGVKLEIVFPTIRTKLANALVRWHPSDISAKQILTPWISVFSKGATDTFLLKNIVPKLQQAMQELVINPLHQVLDPWNWVMEWLELVPLKSIVNIVETMFFPKWLQFLAAWLNQIPHYDDVRQWYLWWRGMFNEKLLLEPVVRDNLQKGLEMIGMAIQCPGQPIDYTYIINRTSQPQPQPQQAQTGQVHATPELMADAIRLTSQVPHGFRDLVQMKCEELGLVFMPVPNRYYEGKQVYKCGNVLIYISGNVIFVQRDGRAFVPVSLNQLIQMAST
jgi:tuftelin-interacting protein 11